MNQSFDFFEFIKFLFGILFFAGLIYYAYEGLDDLGVEQQVCSSVFASPGAFFDYKFMTNSSGAFCCVEGGGYFDLKANELKRGQLCKRVEERYG